MLIGNVSRRKTNKEFDLPNLFWDVESENSSILQTFSFNTRPFVKWAGGKTQLLDEIKEYIPKEFDTYFEPFIGGGALLFSLCPEDVYISDQNSELICAYKCFLSYENFLAFKNELSNHEKNHSEEYFYFIRNKDRDPLFANEPIYVRAGRMVYLNKACFNGLYRVNSSGYFNVPSAKREKVVAFDDENFNEIFRYFSSCNIRIENQDYEKTIKNAKKGDFVYFDPPYDVFPNKNGFVDYGKNGFDKNEQVRLYNNFVMLTERGVKVMISNNSTSFINELYKDFNIHFVNAKRMINSDKNGRGNVEEVIVTNY